MKKILLFAFLLFAGGLFAQTPYDTVNVRDPQNFVEMTSVDTAYFQLIGRKANLNRRMSLTTLKNWILSGGSGIDSVYYVGDQLNILQGSTLWQATTGRVADSLVLSNDSLFLYENGTSVFVDLAGISADSTVFATLYALADTAAAIRAADNTLLIGEIPTDSLEWSSTPILLGTHSARRGNSQRFRPSQIIDLYGKKALLYNTVGTVASIAAHIATVQEPLTVVPAKLRNNATKYMIDTLPQASWQGTRSWATTIFYDTIRNEWVAMIGGNDETTNGKRKVGVATSPDLEAWTFSDNNPILSTATTGFSAYAPDGADAIYARELWYDAIEAKYKMLIDVGINGTATYTVLIAESSYQDSAWTITGTALDYLSVPNWADSSASCGSIIEVNGVWWMAWRSLIGEAGSNKIGLAYASSREGPYTPIDNYIINSSVNISSAVIDYADGEYIIYSDSRDVDTLGLLAFTHKSPAEDIVFTPYEQGYFDINIEDSESPGGVAVLNDSTWAYFIRTYNKVDVWFSIKISTVSGDSASVRITGLPYRAFSPVPDYDNTTDAPWVKYAGTIGKIKNISIDSGYTSVSAEISAGQSFINLIQTKVGPSEISTTYNIVQFSQLSNNASISGHISYITDGVRAGGESVLSALLPSEIDSLAYWFRSDTLVTDSIGGAIANGERVGTWGDISGNYDVAQSDTTRMPVYLSTGGRDGGPAIEFRGNDFLASTAHFWGSDDLTIFAVIAFNDSTRHSAEMIIVKNEATGNTRQWQLFGRDTTRAFPEETPEKNMIDFFASKDGTSSNIAANRFGVKREQWTVYEYNHDGDITPIAYVDGDGATVTTSVAGSGDGVINNSSTPKLSIGATNVINAPGSFFYGRVEELIVFKKSLSIGEMASIRAYLGQ